VPGRRNQYRNTAAGNAVAGVSKAKPVLRKTVEKAVGELLGRVKQVNDDPRYLYRVDKVVLFGPFLTTKSDRVKNADVAVQLSPKETDPVRREEAVRKRARGGGCSGQAVRELQGEAAVRGGRGHSVLEGQVAGAGAAAAGGFGSGNAA
jgi:hypothetical protein